MYNYTYKYNNEGPAELLLYTTAAWKIKSSKFILVQGISIIILAKCPVTLLLVPPSKHWFDNSVIIYLLSNPTI